jgi:3-methyladenine DNA glycosylase AlkD
MALSAQAKKIVSDIADGESKLGDIKKRGKEIRKDHNLAMELWSTGDYHARLLASLIFDKKLLTENVVEELASDLLTHDEDERNQLGDWLLANQLTKDRKLVAFVENWEEDSSPILRRFFWYHQARLRWTGKTFDNSAALLDSLEANMATAEPEVQWAMNFCAGWIGVFEPKLRSRCIKLGKKIGLYKDEPVTKNCTPSYLPEFIRIEAAKRE